MRCAVDVGGLTIAYEQVGAGPPLVLLHGGLADRREWRQQLADLSDEFSVHAWDAPGCGLSDDPPEHWRMPDYAAAVTGWLAALGVERPHLLGLSWGATLALEVYRQQPALSSLVLCGAYAGWAGSLSPEECDRRLQDLLAELERPPSASPPTYLPTMLSPAAPQELVEEVAAVMSDARASGGRPMLRAMAEADLRGVLPTIDVPTLLVYGERDVRAPAEVAQEMHRAIPGASLVVLPDAGHCCHAEAPALFNEAVRQFLRRLE